MPKAKVSALQEAIRKAQKAPGRRVLYPIHPGPQEAFMKAEEEEIFYGGSMGSGKLEHVSALVYTPFGSKKIGDLKRGDQVCTPFGGVSRVIAVWPQGEKSLFRVTTEDGSSVLVGEEHLWLFHVAMKRYKGKDGEIWQVDTTKAIKELLGKGRSVRIPLTEPVCFTPRRRYRPHAPYHMGLLLGDGSLSGYGIEFTSIEAELVAAFGDTIHPRGHNGMQWRVKDRRLQVAVDNAGLHGARSWEKFIPPGYKMASAEDRLSLVQGLMDTDGYVDSGGHCSYTTTSRQLADDMQWMLRSLGFRATMTSKMGAYTKDGKRTETRLAYTLYIQGRDQKRLFRLSRKVDRCVEGQRGFKSSRIISVEPEGNGEAVCISVSHPSGLYLTDDFIVTHNSLALRAWGVNYCMTHPGANIVLFRRKYRELEDTHILNIQREVPLYIANYSSGSHTLIFDNGSTFQFRYCERDEDVRTYFTAEWEAMLLDELTEFSEYQYVNLVTRCRSTKPWWPGRRIRCTGMPLGVGHAWVRSRFIDPAPPNTSWKGSASEGGMTRRFIPARLTDNPTLMKRDPSYLEMLKGLPEEEYRARALGDWSVALGQFLTRWRDHIHIQVPFDVPPDWDKWIFNDYGFNAPFATLWATRPPGSQSLFVYREQYGRNVELDEQVDLAWRVTDETGEKLRGIVLDPSMFGKVNVKGERISPMADSWRQRFGWTTNVFRGNNDRVPGWRLLRELVDWKEAPDGSLFVPPRLHVFDTCANTTRTLPLLVADARHVEDVDTDCEDHAADALRYGIMHVFKGSGSYGKRLRFVDAPRGITILKS